MERMVEGTTWVYLGDVVLRQRTRKGRPERVECRHLKKVKGQKDGSNPN